MTKKDLYRKFSDAHADRLPFCLRYEWWEEIVQDHWDVVVEANGEQVIAVWPYFIRKKGPWRIISNALLTPYSGPFIDFPANSKKSSQISLENKIHEQLIKQLPSFAELNQNFYPGFSNSLSFLWQGFEDHKHYTYVLGLNQEEDTLWEGFRENMRRQIRKAEKFITIEENPDPKLMESLLKESYETQQSSYPQIPPVYFERIFNYIIKHKCGKSWKALDEKGNVHAAITCIWDNQAAYYLIGGASTKFKNSGAISLLLWQAIKTSQKLGKAFFNFEGSSIRPIEKYLRGFGGELIPLSRIIKRASDSFTLAKKLKPSK